MLDKEILDGFKEESNQLMKELTGVVENLEDFTPQAGQTGAFPSALLEEFAQKIDRIMGAAKTLAQLDAAHQGLKRIGGITEICKRLGYKLSEKKDSALVPICAAFWADTIEVIEDLIQSVDDEAKSAGVTKAFAPILQKRLEWLSEKVSAGKGADALDVNSLINQLLA